MTSQSAPPHLRPPPPHEGYDNKLREVYTNTGPLNAHLAHQETQLTEFEKAHAHLNSTKSRADFGRLLGRYSETLRLLGRYEEASAAIKKSVTIWTQLGRAKALFLAQLRTIHIESQYKTQEQVLPRLDHVRENLIKHPMYHDIVEEYIARIYASYGMWEESAQALERCHNLRTMRSNPKGIQRVEVLRQALPVTP